VGLEDRKDLAGHVVEIVDVDWDNVATIAKVTSAGDTSFLVFKV
jgi:hypothetical protein